MNDRKLLLMACEARKHAYAPYSQFTVGAALWTAGGKIYTGCNVENASYGASICAERTAILKAVSEGERDFLKIAIAGGKAGQDGMYCFPCGVCRQVMAEFCHPDTFEIIVDKGGNEPAVYRLADLLPNAFGPQAL